MLDLLHAWILLPALFVATALGLGLLVERASGDRLPGVLMLPLGLVTAIAVAALTTATAASAPATTPVVVVLAVVGLVIGRRREPALAPTVALLLVFLAYGAPVLLSGEATFAGYLKLDDTASWFALTDQVLSAGRSLDALPGSSFQQLLASSVPSGYPLGALTAPGVASQLSGVDPAWGFAPYLSICGAAIAASMAALIAPLRLSARLASVVVAVAAQPALLYGYVQWGGIKEITVAAAMLLLVALGALRIGRGPGPARGLLPFGITSGALLAVVGPGGVGFVGPVFAAVTVGWWWRARSAGPKAVAWPVVRLAGVSLLCSLPTLISLLGRLTYTRMFFDTSADRATLYGNLAEPVRAWQLGGIWFARDFRDAPALWPTAAALAVVALGAVWALRETARRRLVGLSLYVGVALATVLAALLSGGSPWLMGKALAIASPAVPLAALCGAAILVTRTRWGIPLMGLLVAGVVWSNVLTLSSVTLAPRDRLAELQRVASVLEGQGPTFDNQYEVYATRHFLRGGATVQPAELRGVTLPLLDGKYLVQPAWANIDAFPPSTLAPYRSLVVSRVPTESRPSSEFERVWRGSEYDVYRRTGVGTLVRHVPLGDSRSLPYCGNAQNAGPLALCAVQPVAIPTCRVIGRLGKEAALAGGSLVAAIRQAPVVLRGDDVRWPPGWLHDPSGHVLTPTRAGVAVTDVNVPTGGAYELWLGGSFARGFEVRVDGRAVGQVRQRLGSLGAGVRLGSVTIGPGVHRIELEYPKAGLRPGDADAGHLTVLRWIALAPVGGDARLLTVPPAAADSLCGQPLDWVDIVR